MPASVVTLSEFAGAASEIEGVPVAPMPVLVDQVVSVSGTSTLSSPFSKVTRLVRIHTKASCCIVVGPPSSSPTATTNNMSFAQFQTEYLRVNPGDVMAVIADP